MLLSQTLPFFIFGLIIGSFLNAVLWRVKEEMTLWGRSMCPSCQSGIAWYDNIPVVSFFVLGARCRTCRTPISWRYPIVELSTAILFAFFGASFFRWGDMFSLFQTGFYLVSVSIFILIFLYDLETLEIPNIFLWVGVGWALPMLLLLDGLRFSGGNDPSLPLLHSGILGAIVGFTPLFLLAFVSKERWMGMGDGFLAFFLGLVVGWPGILVSLFLAFMLGAGVGMVLIVLGKKHMQSHVPFGPFLIAGALLFFLVSEEFPGMSELFWWWQ